ncbi:glycerophosphodiester phosphodiesterase family protein [Solicola gregarius]|uniref:glycerophosphodiester phosphodiesterase n=1 Tax=Solicola gregarius TaxID=2908642 RepID=A0AA46YJ02_9ACTN|nr:glycerophosphodiester phosphodiesterase family protein [Solicola gregarius]UYM03870.1 glycerophosphodiester phosphodiesterase [Solicola gregarius]
MTAGTPVVIAHRGASGYRPENTIAAIDLAVELGAEWIELDLVSTADGVLVIRHENEISSTTDVASRAGFASRRTTREVDGEALTGWFTEDLTLDELKSLRATERRPDLRPASARHDGRYDVPTLEDVLAYVGIANAERSTPIGVYLELKHPTYFADRGLDLVGPLVADLDRHGLLVDGAPVWLESMETGVLRDLAGRVGCTLTQLMASGEQPYDLTAAGDPRTYRDLCTPAGLAEIATYAQRIGPSKGQVIPRGADRRLRAPTSLTADAHAAGLEVHVWTLRNENVYLPKELRRGTSGHEMGEAAAEYAAFFDAGVDGVFTDFVDTALAARSCWQTSRR